MRDRSVEAGNRHSSCNHAELEEAHPLQRELRYCFRAGLMLVVMESGINSPNFSLWLARQKDAGGRDSIQPRPALIWTARVVRWSGALWRCLG